MTNTDSISDDVFYISLETVISLNCLYELPLELMKNVKSFYTSYSERKHKLSGDVETNPGPQVNFKALTKLFGKVVGEIPIQAKQQKISKSSNPPPLEAFFSTKPDHVRSCGSYRAHPSGNTSVAVEIFAKIAATQIFNS